jgi:YbbR domain-containing protein
LKYFKNLHKDATQEIIFPTVNYTDALSAQLKYKNQITAVSPERIVVKLNKLCRKKLPIVPSLDLSFAEQYMQCDRAVVSPDSVMVCGPKGIIDTLSCIRTEKFKAAGLKENTAVNLRLKLPARNISVKTAFFEAKVTIPVEKFTEKDIEVPLIVRNKPKNMDVKTFPDKIKISCFVALKDFDRVLPDMFSGSVDFDDSQNGSVNMLNVRVDEYPQYVKITRFSPVRVEYIIMK